jgi:uncharacterized membrane protein YecN with MAPEG domain
MVVTIYGSIYTLIIVWLSIRVIKNRVKHRVSVGDGGVQAMQIAMAVQSNAIEYLPIALLLMLMLELNGAGAWLIHAFGMIFIVGRVYHINGMFTQRLKYRVWGMRITFYSLIALAITNVVYIAYLYFW